MQACSSSTSASNSQWFSFMRPSRWLWKEAGWLAMCTYSQLRRLNAFRFSEFWNTEVIFRLHNIAHRIIGSRLQHYYQETPSIFSRDDVRNLCTAQYFDLLSETDWSNSHSLLKNTQITTEELQKVNEQKFCKLSGRDESHRLWHPEYILLSIVLTMWWDSSHTWLE